jgi:hypothetical protein
VGEKGIVERRETILLELARAGFLTLLFLFYYNRVLGVLVIDY